MTEKQTLFPSNEEIRAVVFQDHEVLQNTSPVVYYDINPHLSPSIEPFSLKNVKETTIDDVNQEITSLKPLLKYDFNKIEDKLDEIWFEAVDSLSEEDKDIFYKQTDIAKYRQLRRDVVMPKYNELLEERKNEIENYDLYKKFNENGIAPEDRFNPPWFDPVIAFWRDTINNSPSLQKYRTFPTLVINCTENNADKDDLNALYSYLKNINCDKNVANDIMLHIEQLAVHYSEIAGTSCCLSKYAKDDQPIRTICLNSFYSPITTLQTIWHETTHWIQGIDKNIPTMEVVASDDERKKQSLQIETQANLNASMIVFLQAMIGGCENLDYVKRELIRTANCDKRGYCDFSLTRQCLERLEKDRDFANNFMDGDGINFEKLYLFTDNLARKQSEEIINFAESNGKTYSEMLNDEKLMSDPNNPWFMIKEELEEYYKQNPETRLEKLQENIHKVKNGENRSDNFYKFICEKGRQLKELDNVKQTMDLIQQPQLSAQSQNQTQSKQPVKI